jgi:hypothetical protein
MTKSKLSSAGSTLREMRSAYKVLIGKPKGKIPLGTSQYLTAPTRLGIK